MSEEKAPPLIEILKSKKFKVGDGEYALVDPNEAMQAVKAGFVPSSREYDVYPLTALVPEKPFGDTRVQPTAYMERRPEYEESRVAGRLNELHGKGNWKLVEIQPTDDPKGEHILKLMLKEEIARQKIGRSA